jgi:hypothetical protein
MENRTNQGGQQSSASSQNNPSASNQNTSSAQSRSQNASASSQQQGQPSYTSQSQSQQSPSAQQGGQSSGRSQQQGNQQGRQGQQSNGILGGITSSLSNIQMPQAVKDFGATVSRSYNGLSTTQKVVGGAALALGASYWAAKSSGWVGQGKAMNKQRNKSGR